jgi:phage antirepressor YoqD-like protein
MWLATITASRLTDLQVRARVEQYQNEAADVLADWLEKRASPMPNQHVVPQTYIEALRAHLDAEERAETLRVNLAVTEAQKKALVGQNMLLNETIREAEPKVRGYEQLMESDGTISMAQGAKILNIGMGRNGLFRLLREKKIFQKVGQEPYQEYIDRGYFKLRAGSRPTSGGDEYVMTYTPRITAKGLDYLRKIVIGM